MNSDLKLAVEYAKRALWVHWDPLGVTQDNVGAVDEYDSYAGRVVRCYFETKSAREIEKLLAEIELEFMGQKPNMRKNAKLAKMLVNGLDTSFASADDFAPSHAQGFFKDNWDWVAALAIATFFLSYLQFDGNYDSFPFFVLLPSAFTALLFIQAIRTYRWYQERRSAWILGIRVVLTSASAVVVFMAIITLPHVVIPCALSFFLLPWSVRSTTNWVQSFRSDTPATGGRFALALRAAAPLVLAAYLATTFWGIPSASTAFANEVAETFEMAQKRDKSDPLRYRKVANPKPWSKISWALPVFPGLILAKTEYQVGPLWGYGGISLYLWNGMESREIWGSMLWIS